MVDSITSGQKLLSKLLAKLSSPKEGFKIELNDHRDDLHSFQYIWVSAKLKGKEYFWLDDPEEGRMNFESFEELKENALGWVSEDSSFLDDFEAAECTMKEFFSSWTVKEKKATKKECELKDGQKLGQPIRTIKRRGAVAVNKEIDAYIFEVLSTKKAKEDELD